MSPLAPSFGPPPPPSLAELTGLVHAHPHRINDNAALGRVTNKPGVTSEELEATPMQVEHLDDDAGGESFRAVRVAAGDSVSLAISDRGELRAWGSFRVSSLFFFLVSPVLLASPPPPPFLITIQFAADRGQEATD